MILKGLLLYLQLRQAHLLQDKTLLSMEDGVLGDKNRYNWFGGQRKWSSIFFSSIINGYSESGYKLSNYKLILDYLKKRKKKTLRLKM